jgi:hypothetical protein
MLALLGREIHTIATPVNRSEGGTVDTGEDQPGFRVPLRGLIGGGMAHRIPEDDPEWQCEMGERSQTTTDLRQRALYGVAVDACNQHVPEELDAVAHSDCRSQLDEPPCWPGLQAYGRRRLQNRASLSTWCGQASSYQLAQQAYQGHAA